MAETEISEKVILETVGRHATPPREVKPDDKIAALEIDSLSVVEIVIELEDELGIEIPFNAHSHDLDEDSTVRDLVDHIIKMVNSPPPEPAKPEGDGEPEPSAG